MRCEGEAGAAVCLAVIIVNWNRCGCLRELLLDVRGQSRPAEELIVVDNGSTDGSPEMVEQEFREVRLIRLSRNMGISFGRNVGIEASRSELLMFPDNDLRILDRSFFRRARESALKHLDCGLISFEMIGLSRAGNCLCLSERVFGWHQVETMARDGIALTPQRPFYTAHFPGGASLVRRDTFERVGIFDPSLWYGGEESDFAFRCHERGVRLIVDTGLWVVHKRSPEMRPGSRDATAWENEVIVLARHMPVVDFLLFLPCQVALALISGGDVRTLLHRLVSMGRATCFALSNGSSGKRTRCRRSTMCRYYLLRIHKPESYERVEALAMGPLRFLLLRLKNWFMKRPQAMAFADDADLRG